MALLIKETFFCGYKYGQILTCCPRQENTNFSIDSVSGSGSCSLQQGGPASCVSYNKCPPFTLMINNLIKPLTKAVPFIMQEVYLCGVDTDLGLNVPKICCPDQALATSTSTTEEEELTPTTTTTTSTTRAPVPWYRTHPGFPRLASLDICGRSFVNVSIDSPGQTDSPHTEEDREREAGRAGPVPLAGQYRVQCEWVS